MTRRRHAKKEVEQALADLEVGGFRFVERKGRGHVTFVGYCPCGQCPLMNVWGTPRNPGTHAKQLRRRANRCPGLEGGQDR